VGCLDVSPDNKGYCSMRRVIGEASQIRPWVRRADACRR
jgi:hypothetical protein